MVEVMLTAGGVGCTVKSTQLHEIFKYQMELWYHAVKQIEISGSI